MRSKIVAFVRAAQLNLEESPVTLLAESGEKTLDLSGTMAGGRILEILGGLNLKASGAGNQIVPPSKRKSLQITFSYLIC